MKQSRVLVVDDDSTIRKVLLKVLELNDCDVSAAATGEEAMDLFGQEYFDLVLLDINLPGTNGSEVLKEIKRKSPSTAVVMMTGFGSIETAIHSIKLGADDFLQKPFDTEHLIKVVRQVLERTKILKAAGQVQDGDPQLLDELAGGSRLVKELRRIIERVALSRNPLLISGEPGVGKKTIARLIHQFSDRSARPFVVVDCGQDCVLLESRLFGQSQGSGEDSAKDCPGLFEQANSGAIVFEEIGALGLESQTQVLNFLERSNASGTGYSEDSSVDVRVIALTSQNLRKLIEDGKFLKDLYSGLSAIPIYVPPLREHIEDLSVLINHFLNKLRKPGIQKPNAASPEYLEILEDYDFPGNVRELENIVSHSLSLTAGMILTPETLPAQLASRSEINALARQSTDQDLNLKQAKALATERTETKLIRRVLNESQGNFSMAARKLGISRSALYYKIKKYKIDTTQ